MGPTKSLKCNQCSLHRAPRIENVINEDDSLAFGAKTRFSVRGGGYEGRIVPSVIIAMKSNIQLRKLKRANGLLVIEDAIQATGKENTSRLDAYQTAIIEIAVIFQQFMTKP